uniref:Uncharacterized protein n=1 Tax=Macrostomum lignano TaxID=282301 RepID=A0A1I8FRH0_9PLAT
MNDSCPNYNLRRRLFGADDTAFHWRRRLQLKPSVAPGAAIPDASQQKSVLPFDPRELDAKHPEQAGRPASTETLQVGRLQFGRQCLSLESPHLGYLLWPSRPGGIDGCTLESLDPLHAACRQAARCPPGWCCAAAAACSFRRPRNAEAVGIARKMRATCWNLALFFSGPAPIVLAGRKLKARERLSEQLGERTGTAGRPVLGAD